MGVEGSTKLLGDGKSIVMAGKKGVVIDASQLTYQLGKGHCCTNEIIRNDEGDVMTSCFKMLEFILIWLDKYVIKSYEKGDGCTVPIFVFDGRASKSKSSTIKKRKEKQGSALKKLDQITEQIRSDQRLEREIKFSDEDTIMNEYSDLLIHSNECIDRNRQRAKAISFKSIDSHVKEQYTKHLRNSYNPGSEIAYIRLLLNWMGIPYIESPSEGDAQCAALSVKFGMGTITADIDIVLLGGKSIYKFDNMRHLLLREYKMTDIINRVRNQAIRVIERCESDCESDYGMSSYRDASGNIDLKFNLDDLRAICCLLGTDYCPGLKIDRSKIGLESAILLYLQNGRDLKKLLEHVRDNRSQTVQQMIRLGFMTRSKYDSSKYPRITEQYIQRMIDAFAQYNSERVYDPPDDIVRLTKPNIPSLIGFCSAFLNRDSIIKLVEIVQKASSTYQQYLVTPIPQDILMKTAGDPSIPPKSMFGNFGSYHRRCDRIGRNDRNERNEHNQNKRWKLQRPDPNDNRTWKSRTLTETCEELSEVTLQPRFVSCDHRSIRCACRN
jgi:5'-3' exonuclease